MEIWALVMFAVVMVMILMGYPVAFTLGGVALWFGIIFLGIDFFNLLPLRIWGIMTNFTLLAVPLFVFMGIILEKSGLAEDLLETIGLLFGTLRGGLALSIIAVGALLAATTGVVGATVVTMGIISLPSLLKNGYSPALATGTIAAAGTLGQIIPPSIVLILLGDVVGVPVGQLFLGAITPGILLVLVYISYVIWKAWSDPQSAPSLAKQTARWDRIFLERLLKNVLPALLLIIMVLGSIFLGIATPTESAAFGALGALILVFLHKRLTFNKLTQAMQHTTRLTSMVFLILIGATTFGLVFRGMGGDHLVHEIFTHLPGGAYGFIIVSLILIFILGFFLDFLEICFIVVPILTPIAQHFQIDLLWFAILIAVNLQTSFLTPPFGFSLFYLKAVAPPTLPMSVIYQGIIPYVILQVLILILLASYPPLTLWLPNYEW
jgi:tripartite ATP-independent transporter DctM subunit